MKNKALTCILALTLGSFGAHRFYLEQKKLGWFYLAFFWTAIPLVVSIIDGFVFAFMNHAKFNRKYSLKHTLKKKFEHDEEILEFNTDEKLEQQLLDMLDEMKSKERIEEYLQDSKTKGVYLPRAVYAKAQTILAS